MTYLFRAPRPFVSPLSLVLALPLACAIGCGGNVAGSPGSGAQDDDASTTTTPPIILLPPIAKHDAGSAVDGGSADATSAVDAFVAPVTAVPLFSCQPSEYTAAVTIGESQVFQLTIDTGSTSLGVAGASCPSCGQSLVYDPGSTSTDENQTAFSQYGSGSWSGNIFQDSVKMGTDPGAPVDLVSITSSSQFFEPADCDSSIGGYQGIIGFGPSGSAVQGTNGFFDQLVATTHIPDIFSTELCDSGGTLWLGGYDPTFTTAAPQYTPLEPGISQFYYAVNLVSVTVAGKTVPIATQQFNSSIVDTGTSIFILPNAAFTGITNAIANTPGYRTVFHITTPLPEDAGVTDSGVADGGASDAAPVTPPNPAAFFDNIEACAQLSQTKAELDAMLPPLTFTFGSNPAIEVQALPTESYLMQYQGQWCPTLYPMNPSQDDPLAAIVGSPILRSNIVIFDRAASRIGFAPHTACP